MRDPKRIDYMLELFGVFWKKNPDLRMAQAISILNILYRRDSNKAPDNDVFNLEDDDLEITIRKQLQ